MNLGFSELKCPKCGSDMESGNTSVGVDVNMVKRCVEKRTGLCDFWMIIVIPNDDYEYSTHRKLKTDKTVKP